MSLLDKDGFRPRFNKAHWDGRPPTHARGEPFKRPPPPEPEPEPEQVEQEPEQALSPAPQSFCAGASTLPPPPWKQSADSSSPPAPDAGDLPELTDDERALGWTPETLAAYQRRTEREISNRISARMDRTLRGPVQEVAESE